MVNRKDLDPTESPATLLGYKLREYRDGERISQAQLAAAVNYSPDLISKIELGHQAPTPELAAVFDKRYGTGDWFQRLQPLAAKAGIPVFFQPYAELEAGADESRVYSPDLISGILQTEEYARAIFETSQPTEEVEKMTAGRMARQTILKRDNPPWLVIVLAEMAVRKVVGSSEITKAQLSHVLALMDESNIIVRVMPHHAPVYPSTGFTLFSRDDKPDIAFIEGTEENGHVVSVDSKVKQLRRTWDRISNVALIETDSKALIREAMEDL
ncbi:helix-turn-helix domain-containing protein [Actinomadura atramentaria]|uniref:helix-turn-helix domain-containing protein n=1 Tax=Actinomadura atramentaria TaxID=1990 RepID=UPI00037015B9|nr:helix-turn-helix transcriptional regulator [Actinomadura atramentaria]